MGLGIGGFVGGLIRHPAKTISRTVKKVVSQPGKAVQTAVKSTINQPAKVVSNVVNKTATNVVRTAKQPAKTVVDLVKKPAQKVVPANVRNSSGYQKVVKPVLNAPKNAVSKASTNISRTIKQPGSAFSKFIKNPAKSIVPYNVRKTSWYHTTVRPAVKMATAIGIGYATGGTGGAVLAGLTSAATGGLTKAPFQPGHDLAMPAAIGIGYGWSQGTGMFAPGAALGNYSAPALGISIPGGGYTGAALGNMLLAGLFSGQGGGNNTTNVYNYVQQQKSGAVLPPDQGSPYQGYNAVAQYGDAGVGNPNDIVAPKGVV